MSRRAPRGWMSRSGWCWAGCWRSAAAWRWRSGTWRRCRRGRGRTAGAWRRRPGTRAGAGCRPWSAATDGTGRICARSCRPWLRPGCRTAGGDLIGPGIAIDETADLKDGDTTACTAPQHAGCTGKVENCVTTVFSAYVTASGQAWVDFDVYMPDRWAGDMPRRRAAGIPDDLVFATKPPPAGTTTAPGSPRSSPDLRRTKGSDVL